MDANVKADVVGGRVEWGDGAEGGCLRSKGGDVEVRVEIETCDEDIAAEEEIGGRALKAQGCVTDRADALRIANANGFAGDGEVSVKAVLISEIAGEREQAATANSGEGANFESVLIELKMAMKLAETVGEIFKRERAVLKVDVANEAGIGKSTVGLNVE